jgi:hypothetical protein
LPLFPLILVVIFAGLMLGGMLAHFFGGRSSTVARTPSQPAFTMAPAASVSPIASVSPSATVTPTARPSSSPSPKPTPSLSPPTVRPSATPKAVAVKPLPAATARAVVYITPAPSRTSAVSATAPAMVAAAVTAAPNYVAPGNDQAAQIVRSYLGSLARGDRATATTYLAHGLPSEGFMDASSRILSIRPEGSASQQYKVTADVQTSTGEYYITFTLQPGPGGLQITDHYSIKTQ